MSFRPHLLLILMILVVHSQLGADSRPNILFIFADDQRADTIAALGNPVIKTPNLDRLVRSGVAFNRAYMQGGMNVATCMPSRAMLLSGRNLFHVKDNLQENGACIDTWPAAFARSGYTTFMTGKWHNSPESLPYSFQFARSVYPHGFGNPMELDVCNLANGKLGPAHKVAKHSCAVFSDEAIQFINTPKDRPFFAYVAYDAPHDPHIVPPDFNIHYSATDIPLPGNFLPQHPWNNGEMTVRDELLLPWPRQPEAVKAYLAEYYRYVSYLDMQIGRILDALEASPYAKNTVVVFSADSGVACGSHGLIGKQNLYENDAIRVPLIISGPGIPSNERTDAMCYLFDVLPTLGRICEISPPSGSEGVSFTATLNDPAHPARSELLFAYRKVQRAYTNGRWKIIRYPYVDKTQLFDLQADPLESNNLAEDPNNAGLVAGLLERMKKAQVESDDKAPLSIANPLTGAWYAPEKSARNK